MRPHFKGFFVKPLNLTHNLVADPCLSFLRKEGVAREMIQKAGMHAWPARGLVLIPDTMYPH